MAGDGGDDYKIGRGRPPLETRFRKGRSGNPRGRPRGAKTLLKTLFEVLNERVEVTADGPPRKVTRRRLGLIALADQFARGDPSAVKIVIGLTERRLPPEPVAAVALDADDRKAVEDFIARLRTS
jgi:hypothetical protein